MSMASSRSIKLNSIHHRTEQNEGLWPSRTEGHYTHLSSVRLLSSVALTFKILIISKSATWVKILCHAIFVRLVTADRIQFRGG